MEDKLYAYATRNLEGDYVVLHSSTRGEIPVSKNRRDAARTITDYIFSRRI